MNNETMKLIEQAAEELIKIPKGYLGITDPISPEERERQLKRTRIQAEEIISMTLKDVGKWLCMEAYSHDPSYVDVRVSRVNLGVFECGELPPNRESPRFGESAI